MKIFGEWPKPLLTSPHVSLSFMLLFSIFYLHAAWKFLKELYPNHSAFVIYDKKMASNANVGEQSFFRIFLVLLVYYNSKVIQILLKLCRPWRKLLVLQLLSTKITINWSFLKHDFIDLKHLNNKHFQRRSLESLSKIQTWMR